MNVLFLPIQENNFHSLSGNLHDDSITAQRSGLLVINTKFNSLDSFIHANSHRITERSVKDGRAM